MPLNYQFVDRTSNAPVDLNEIDARMCKAQGIECHPTRFCMLYQLCTMLGTAVRVQADDGSVDLGKLDTYFNDEIEQPWTEADKEWVRKFLVKDYIFKSWYTRHK